MLRSIISKGFSSPGVYLSFGYWIFSVCRLKKKSTRNSHLAKTMRPREKTCVPIRVILRFRELWDTVLKGHCLLLKWIAADLQRTATGQQRTASGLQRTASGLQRTTTDQQRTTTGLQRTRTYSLKIVQTAIGLSVSNNSLAVWFAHTYTEKFKQ